MFANSKLLHLHNLRVAYRLSMTNIGRISSQIGQNRFTFVVIIFSQPTAAPTRIKAPILSGVLTLSMIRVKGMLDGFSNFNIFASISSKSKTAEIENHDKNLRKGKSD